MEVEVTVVKVQRLEDGLMHWPLWSNGAYQLTPAPTTVPRSPGLCGIKRQHFAGFTEEGLDTLSRILRGVIERNRVK